MNYNSKSDIEVYEDNSFNYEGFQVVRGEFFAHIYEPSFTFSNNKVYVNMACIKKLPNFDYIQILVNPNTKKLAVRPCSEDKRDSFRWCSATNKRTPKHITGKVFYAKVMSLMNWDPCYRYKLLGKLIKSSDELLFVFDLESPEIYETKTKVDNTTILSRTPSYSEAWKDQFGVSFSEHKSIQIETFNGYQVFTLQSDTKSRKKTAAIPKDNITTETKSEVLNNGTQYEQLSIKQTEAPDSVTGSPKESNTDSSQYTNSFRQTQLHTINDKS